MGRGPVSYVRHISISGDSKNTDFEQIRMAIGINSGTNIKSVDLRQINNRISHIPGIKNSSVRRLANGDIIIKTQQYKVAAQWSDGELFYPLSVDGVKINTPSNMRNENTIVFRGEIPQNLSKIINDVSALSKDIDYMTIIENRRWNIRTHGGITIYLPENNPSVAINKINRLNQTHKLLSRDIEIIDMRDDARILVKTRK